MSPLALLPILASVVVSTFPSAPPVIRVVARNYAFEVPAAPSGGLVTLRLVNHGEEPHYARLLRLGPGKTLADFAALRQRGGRGAEWLTPSGGLAPVSPGDSADLTTTLAPGRYVLLCGYPGRDGRAHVDHGMMREIVIGAGPRTPPRHPREDLRLRVTDGALAWSAAVTPGRHVVRVENDGSQAHQVLLTRLPTGASLDDEKRWFEEGFRGERPGRPAGGVIELARGQRVWLTMDFVPGRYGVLCHLSGADGSSHFAAGEAVEFKVAESS